jgi:hypothetical protein
MRRWAQYVLGRWKERRIRTKRIRAMYRLYEQNRAILDNGGTL